eukprot:TRINITY_DN11066_c0_g1_i1.p2 TRINITY_DN11066_c0_g1~~TRINITY_DN11066_c0_g1_i1.p2  ORF type:complete len:210 (-),score=39.03 TRINITY_DN11066_c0_g1_i1:192-821(-)
MAAPAAALKVARAAEPLGSPMMILRRALRRYDDALRLRPTPVNMASAGFLGFVGDTFCQFMSGEQFSWRQNAALTLFCTGYQGFVSYRIFQFYERLVPMWMTGKMLQVGVYKSCIDNFIHVPFLYMPAFYTSTGLMQGRSFATSVEELKANYGESTLACMAMWLPVQTATFAVIPSHWIIVWVNAWCLVWNAALSYYAMKAKDMAAKSE